MLTAVRLKILERPFCTAVKLERNVHVTRLLSRNLTVQQSWIYVLHVVVPQEFFCNVADSGGKLRKLCAGSRHLLRGLEYLFFWPTAPSVPDS